jgi:very-short-patch-repair endonuclease
VGSKRPSRRGSTAAWSAPRSSGHSSTATQAPPVRGACALCWTPGAALTRSEAESRFLDLVRQARLPEPSANHRVEGMEVDFYWRRARLVVEVDGFAFHGSVRAFEADRRRDARLVAAGLRVLRVTWRQLTGEPLAVIARVAMVLGRSTDS